MIKKTNKQYTTSMPDLDAIQKDHWNSKLETLADTLLQYIRADEEQEEPRSKGVYIDFKQLK